MKCSQLLGAVIAVLLLCSCHNRQPRLVDPRDHDSFFLWPGVRPPAVLDRARSIYILAGEVRRDDNSRIVPLRSQVPRISHAEVWLTLRVERLDWGGGIQGQLDRMLRQWSAANRHFAGLQIDFDAATNGLDNYAEFLRTLRSRLPKGCRLSVTGLMDWSANGDPRALATLAGTVDEVVIQTYQGRKTIPGYQAYMRGLARLPVPYRVGLVEGGEWQAPEGLEGSRLFRGYVVFLLNRPRLPGS